MIRPPEIDQHRAVNLAVQVMSMIKCSADNQPWGLLELGARPLQWHSDKSLADFISGAFPQRDTGNLQLPDHSGRIRDVTSALSAKRLKRIAGLKFHGTDDLQSHLKLDVKRGVVELYHHTSVLRGHLTASHRDNCDESIRT